MDVESVDRAQYNQTVETSNDMGSLSVCDSSLSEREATATSNGASGEMAFDSGEDTGCSCGIGM